jgi:hypothetical protein
MASSQILFLDPSDASHPIEQIAGLPAGEAILPDHTCKNNELRLPNPAEKLAADPKNWPLTAPIGHA